MAEYKKSFLLYCDLIHTIEKLPDDKAGVLFKHILKYVNDKNPTTEDLVVDLVFEPIKQQLKRDLETWRLSKFDKSQNGILGNLKRWNPDLYNQVIENQISIEKAQEIAKHRKSSLPDSPLSPPIANVAVNVNATVTDNVIDNVIVNENIDTGKPSVFNFKNSLLQLCNDKTLVNDWLVVRKNKKCSNTETALNGFLKQVELSGYPISDVLTKCIERSWGGFEAEWYSCKEKIDIKTHAPVWKFENGDEVTVLKDGSKITANDYYGNELQWIDKVVNWRKCR